MIDLNKIKLDAFYTTGELAEILEVKRQTITAWVRKGMRKTAVVGGYSYFVGQEVFNYWARAIDKRLTGKTKSEIKAPTETNNHTGNDNAEQ